jgi:hypothetical protein
MVLKFTSYLFPRGNMTTFSSLIPWIHVDISSVLEKEESLPEGWNPLHVQKGFKPSESVVSTFTGWSMVDYGGFAQPHHKFIQRMLTSFFSMNSLNSTTSLKVTVARRSYRPNRE